MLFYVTHSSNVWCCCLSRYSAEFISLATFFSFFSPSFPDSLGLPFWMFSLCFFFSSSFYCLLSTMSLILAFALWLSVLLTLCHFLPTECVNAFALVVRPPTEQENLLFSFQLAGEDTVKSTWLRTLCRHVANTICRADAVRRHTHTKATLVI